jgi:hypothetical protein
MGDSPHGLIVMVTTDEQTSECELRMAATSTRDDLSNCLPCAYIGSFKVNHYYNPYILRVNHYNNNKLNTFCYHYKVNGHALFFPQSALSRY